METQVPNEHKVSIDNIEYILKIFSSNNPDKIKFMLSYPQNPNDYIYKREYTLLEMQQLCKYFRMFDKIEDIITDLNLIISTDKTISLVKLNEKEILFTINLNINKEIIKIEIKLNKINLNEKNNDILYEKISELENENKFLKEKIHNFETIFCKEIKFRNLNLDSKIFTNIDQYELIKKQICNLYKTSNDINLKLIYRATKNGGLPSKFHKYCNGISQTLSLIKTNNLSVFGGYAEKEWKNSGGHIRDDNSFLFSFDYMKIYTNKKIDKDYGIFCDLENGPWFSYAGGMAGGDFFFYNKHYVRTLSNLSYVWNNFNMDYELNKGTEYFSALEVEVFKVNLMKNPPNN